MGDARDERHCPRCGTVVAPEDEACGRCAAKVKSAVTLEVRVSPPEGAATAPPFAARRAPSSSSTQEDVAFGDITLSAPSVAPAARTAGDACPACGGRLERDWRFCKACGLPVADGTEEEVRHLLIQLSADGMRARRSHDLEGASFVVGRSLGDAVISDDPALSGSHVSFGVDGPRCWVSDLDSTNGTFVAARGFEPLVPGSVIIAGRTRLLYRRGEGPHAADRELVEVLPGGDLGRVFTLGDAPTTIGKSGAHVTIAEDPVLSRRHAEVTPTGSGHAVRDLGSRNGTWVLVTDRRELEDGDHLLVGSTILEYRRLA